MQSLATRRWARAAAVVTLLGCAADGVPPGEGSGDGPEATAFLDDLQARTFRFFWDYSDPRTGITHDRAPSRSFASVAATGFALTAYPIGVERGYVSRAQAGRRVLTTLRFFWDAPQNAQVRGAAGYRGFYYHFLDLDSGRRFENVELSTIDTALLMAGVLFCQSYFDGQSALEDSIRVVAESLYTRVDWEWARVRPPTLALGWKPESGFLPYDWRGYNEAMLLHVLALGSPRHPVSADVWPAWCSRYRWGEFYGEPHVGFAPLFGHQYSHVWIDFRGIYDDSMRERGIDYFENSVRAVRAQHAYAVANPNQWAGYGEHAWGLTACDGPVNGSFEVAGRMRQFHTYMARGASFTGVQDDGTLCPSAVGGSIVFAPKLVIATLMSMRDTYGEHLFSRYGFLDAFNPSFQLEDVDLGHGKVVPGIGWFDTDYLGIDQGPILAMIENHRSELVWRVMRRNPHVVRGLRAAGFRGGWLDDAEAP